MGLVAFFENFIQIACLLFAWVLVLLAFFVLAVQLFITLIEFKLTTLAGFVLIPFGLFGKTAFMAERVLGNVISSGIKVLVLAVIIGIGSTLFSQFPAGFGGPTPTIDDAMAVVLAALSLLGLGIFGPGIANGIVSGGPQLGAGSAIGTGLVAGGAARRRRRGRARPGRGVMAISGAAAAARGGATRGGCRLGRLQSRIRRPVRRRRRCVGRGRCRASGRRRSSISAAPGRAKRCALASPTASRTALAPRRLLEHGNGCEVMPRRLPQALPPAPRRGRNACGAVRP